GPREYQLDENPSPAPAQCNPECPSTFLASSGHCCWGRQCEAAEPCPYRGFSARLLGRSCQTVAGSGRSHGAESGIAPKLSAFPLALSPEADDNQRCPLPSWPRR